MKNNQDLLNCPFCGCWPYKIITTQETIGVNAIWKDEIVEIGCGNPNFQKTNCLKPLVKGKTDEAYRLWNIRHESK